MPRLRCLVNDTWVLVARRSIPANIMLPSEPLRKLRCHSARGRSSVVVWIPTTTWECVPWEMVRVRRSCTLRCHPPAFTAIMHGWLRRIELEVFHNFRVRGEHVPDQPEEDMYRYGSVCVLTSGTRDWSIAWWWTEGHVLRRDVVDRWEGAMTATARVTESETVVRLV